ncbi:MAG: hypothetical protein H6Q20_1181 [Bacteroidetes bacterium]|jgi:hypothetical protein|nr:hypothetical protein [Bacteroidota bacterium]
MSALNRKGPDNMGSQTGRKLGKCGNNIIPDSEYVPGQGMGLRRKAGLNNINDKKLYKK